MELYHPHSIEITTLTPTCIGGNGQLSPLTDFVVGENKIGYINQDKLEALLKGKVLDDFVENTYKGNQDLESFLTARGVWQDDLVDFWVNSHGYDLNQRQLIHRIATTAGKPYLAGSSLKGAFITAILYDFLKIRPEIIKEIIPIIEDYYSKKIEHKLFPEEKFKKIIEDFKNIENKITDKFKITLIDKTKNSLLSVSDSQSIDFQSNIEIHLTNRLHLGSGESEVPICYETLRKGVKTNTVISFRKNDEDNKMDFIKKNDSMALWKMLNTFSLENVKLELELLNESKQKTKEIEVLKAFLTEKIEQINNASPTEAFIRIGSGKSFFNQTIGLLLRAANKDVFVKFRKLNKIGKTEEIKVKIDKKQANSTEIRGFGALLGKFGMEENSEGIDQNHLFPLTRTLTHVGKEPMGWVKIEEK